MLGISGGEFLVLIVVAVIFLGPKHAAQAVRALRAGLGYIRDFSSQLRSQISTQHAQSTLEGLGITEDDLAALRELRASTGSLDPRAFVRKAVSEEMDAWLGVQPTTSTTSGFPKNAYKKLTVADIKKNAAITNAASTSANNSVEKTDTKDTSKSADEPVKSVAEEPQADNS
ncbi:MAG: hypothetical protein IKZ87_05295 [Actinomycetaceae bacterium]|nr:hypothetical protein [Actinomycetaceae bacterium]